jgi:hypothetical protein
MEPLWSPVVATGGNHWQNAQGRKPQKQAKTVATGCHRLPEKFHGKGRVDPTSLLLKRGSPSSLRKRDESREPEGTQDSNGTYRVRETNAREVPSRRMDARLASDLLFVAAAGCAREQGFTRFHLGGGADAPLHLRLRFGLVESAVGKEIHDEQAHRALGGQGHNV